MQRISKERERERGREGEKQREIEREREERQKQLYRFLPQTGSSPIHLAQGEFTKIYIWLQMLTAKTSKRLQPTQTQLQEIYYAQEQNQETSYAQAQLQKTSTQTKLQRKLFDVEHMIYNEWCSQYK